VTLPRFFTPAEVAGVIRRTESHVRALIREGTLVAVDVARKRLPDRGDGKPRKHRPAWIVPESELVAYLAAQGLPASAFVDATDATDARVEARARAQRQR
jgi:hypothetical protein